MLAEHLPSTSVSSVRHVAIPGSIAAARDLCAATHFRRTRFRKGFEEPVSQSASNRQNLFVAAGCTQSAAIRRPPVEIPAVKPSLHIVMTTENQVSARASAYRHILTCHHQWAQRLIDARRGRKQQQ